MLNNLSNLLFCKYNHNFSIGKTFCLNFLLKMLYKLVLTNFRQRCVPYLRDILYFRRIKRKINDNVK